MDEASALPNQDQIAYWNEQAGPKWVALADRIDAQIRPIGERVMERAGIGPGQRVIDIGCGCGETTVELARRVGAEGSVLGIDISAPMLERAGDRLRAAGLAHARVLRADAQTHAFEPGAADRIFSRFGVMFFEQPEAAFRNLVGALAPGGTLAFVCWQELERNPWMAVPVAAAARHIELPPPPEPGTPGPFSMADPERLTRLLEAAGFGKVELHDLSGTLLLGGPGTLDEAVSITFELGPAARVLRDAPASLRAEVSETVRDALRAYETPEGVRLRYAAWGLEARP